MAVDHDQAVEDVVEAPEVEQAEEYDYSPPEHWTEEERTAYERLASLNEVPWDQVGRDPIDGRELQKLWKDRYSNWDKGFNKKMQEVAEQRKTFQSQQEQFNREAQAYQSLANLTRPYVQEWHKMGQLPDQVAAQAFHYATQYYKDPVGTLVSIARDGGFMNEVLEAINGQEYVDPRIEQIQRQNAALQQQIAAQQQHQQYAQLAPFIRQIQEFQGAVVEDGSPKYPHSQRLWPTMAEIIRSGQANNLEEAYNQALWTLPEERERLVNENAKAKAQKAKEDAERAEQAGKRVQAKQTGSGKAGRSLRDELAEQLTSAGFAD